MNKIFLGLVSFALATSFVVGCGKSSEPATRKGYVYVSKAMLMEGPSTSTKQLVVMAKDTNVEVLETVKISESESWYKVKLADGKTGFVYGGYVGLDGKKGTKLAKDIENKPRKFIKELKIGEPSIMDGTYQPYKVEELRQVFDISNSCMHVKQRGGSYFNVSNKLYEGNVVVAMDGLDGASPEGTLWVTRYYENEILQAVSFSYDTGGYVNTGEFCEKCGKNHLGLTMELMERFQKVKNSFHLIEPQSTPGNAGNTTALVAPAQTVSANKIPYNFYSGEYRIGNERYVCMYDVRVDIAEKVTEYTFQYLLGTGYTRVIKGYVKGNVFTVTDSMDTKPKMAPINIGVLNGQQIDFQKDDLGRKLWKARNNARKTSNYYK